LRLTDLLGHPVDRQVPELLARIQHRVVRVGERVVDQLVPGRERLAVGVAVLLDEAADAHHAHPRGVPADELDERR